MAGKWENLRVGGQEMGAYVSHSDSGGSHPGVVVIMEAFGVNHHIESVADWLAGNGYLAIAPDLYHRQGTRLTCGYTEDKYAKWMGNLRDDELIADVGAAVDFLKEQSNVGDQRFGIVGFCVGGRISYLIAGSNQDIGAAVVFYGGNIMRPFGGTVSPLDRTSNIQSPVLGLFGELDDSPSVADVQKIEGELKKLGKPHEFHVYPGADHGFNCDERDSYHPEASKDARSRTLGWFDKYLKN